MKGALVEQNVMLEARVRALKASNESKKGAVVDLLGEENQLRVNFVNSDCSLMKGMHLVLERQKSVS